MTIDESISILSNTAWLGTDEDRERTEEAVKVAITAMKSVQPVTITKSYDGLKLQNCNDKISKESINTLGIGICTYAERRKDG